MNVAIVGFGREGKSSYEYCKNQGFNITICDKNIDSIAPKSCDTRSGDNYLENLNSFDIIYRTASINPNLIARANPNTPTILQKVTTNTNEFFKACRTKNIIGITGTKGKSTTSTLIARMLEASGQRTHLGGNIGIPPLELLKNNIEPSDWIVLEMSSFQLSDLNYSPHIGVMLMLAEEHLDWHNSLDEYTAAKANIFSQQTNKDIAIYYANNEYSKLCAQKSAGQQIPFGHQPGACVKNNKITIGETEICGVNDVALLGKHNIQNICAAITTVWQVNQNAEAIKGVLGGFSGLPFRLEKRATIKGISYYNDSYASNPTATIAAINTVKEPKILLAGGKDRGLDLTNLTDVLASDSTIKKVLLIGESGPRLATALRTMNCTNFEVMDGGNMQEFVQIASNIAAPGDAVLLSPGFPSFDMFKDFEDRGIQFNQAVQNI